MRLAPRLWKFVMAGLLLMVTAGLVLVVFVDGVLGTHNAWRSLVDPGAGSSDGASQASGTAFGAAQQGSDPSPSPSPAGTPESTRCASDGGPDASLAAALARVLHRHQGRFAVGVTDLASGVTASYHGAAAFNTASIVKADILAVLLLKHQQAGTTLSEGDRELAAEMIENSDNDAATDLWDENGAAAGMAAGNAALGLHGIVPGADDYWGLTKTTVRGQLGLLSDLVSARSPLSARSRAYELGLMRRVEPDQAWGVTAAAGPHTRQAVKNGWLPTGQYGKWTVNSIGVVRHAGRRLEIAVLSSGQPSMTAGIRQAEAAARAAAVIAATTATCQDSQ